jgi:hypothetical protein
LPENEQTSKHRRGGRHDAILEFKGEQINFFMRRKKRKKEKERKKKCIRKRKNASV